MINPMRSQPTRMMGLASGMDTDFIIQQTLKMHQFKIDNQMRNKKLIEWRQQTHSSIKSEISALRSSFLSNLGGKSMMSRNAFNATKATITGGKAGAVSVSTTTGTPLGSMKIGQVTSLAKGASLTSGSSVSNGGVGFNPNSRLDSITFANDQKISFSNYQAAVTDVSGNKASLSREDAESAVFGSEWKTKLTFDGDTAEIIRNSDGISVNGTVYKYEDFEDEVIKFTFNGKEFSLTKGEDDKLSLDGKTLSFYQEATIGTGPDAIILQKYEGTAPGVFAVNDKQLAFEGSTTLTINDKEITINSNDTIATMLDKVNKSGAGVTMSYNRLTDRFSLEAAGTSSTVTADIRVSGTGNLLDLLSGTGGAVATDGSQARVFINGDWVTSNTNSFEYRGVRITLNDTTSVEDGETTVTFSRDAQPAIDRIKEFIDSYNAIIRRLEGLLSERKSSNEVGYKPLTDEEKVGMTDKQIDEWEAIARKGLLRNDNGIQNLVTSLRRTFFDQIEGAGLSPSQIGLTTGSYQDGTGGQIMINEEKLRAALESDPDKVADVFIRIDSSGSSPRGVGLLHKIDGLMRDYVNTTQSTSIRNLEDSLKRANEQIQKMQERMFAEEDRLYKVFASMESSMQKLQQQGGWFNAMLGQ